MADCPMPIVRISQTPMDIWHAITMPEMDGFTFLSTIREQDRFKAIPVAVVTAKDLTLEDYGRLNGYVEAVLAKGIHTKEGVLSDVRALIRRLVQREYGAEVV